MRRFVLAMAVSLYAAQEGSVWTWVLVGVGVLAGLIIGVLIDVGVQMARRRRG